MLLLCRRSIAALVLMMFLGTSNAIGQAVWNPLGNDGLHDRRSPGIKEKQEPSEALGEIAKRAPDPQVGNQVRWVKALEDGVINPRAALWSETKTRTLDLDIYLSIGGSMPIVRFPHKAHTLWLDCNNCHERVFKSKLGTTEITMLSILEGEQCGMCHGAVAFPLTECNRCHSVPQSEFPILESKLGLQRSSSGKAAVVKQ